MNIEIDTNDNQLSYELMNKEIKDGVSLSKGEKIEFDGITVTYNGTIIRKAVDIPSTIQLAVSFASSVAAGVIANWLYDKIHRKAGKLTIDGTVVEFDKGEITRIIETHMKKE